jgi:ubiquitin-protein ligase
MQLQIEFLPTYPATPPSVRLVTPIFHPNGQPANQQTSAYTHTNTRAIVRHSYDMPLGAVLLF